MLEIKFKQLIKFTTSCTSKKKNISESPASHWKLREYISNEKEESFEKAVIKATSSNPNPLQE